MKYQDETYGERFAEVYDAFYASHDEEAISLLAELAAGGRALELGIGTGRMALPLAKRGIEVVGIDASEAMIERLRAKPGGADLRTVQGSFAAFPEELDGDHYELIFVVFNTFFALLTQEKQLQCFESAADHLSEGGYLLIEAFVPDLGRFEDGQTVRLIDLDEDAVRLDAATVDVTNQQISSQNVLLSPEGVKLYPVRLRYAWPAELDLMAKLAGLALAHRWGSWQRDPFRKESSKHISVYTHAEIANR